MSLELSPKRALECKSQLDHVIKFEMNALLDMKLLKVLYPPQLHPYHVAIPVCIIKLVKASQGHLQIVGSNQNGTNINNKKKLQG